MDWTDYFQNTGTGCPPATASWYQGMLFCFSDNEQQKHLLVPVLQVFLLLSSVAVGQ